MFDLFYKKAEAVINGNSKHRSIKGKITFVQKKDGVHITADIFGLPQNDCGGFFGFHIHEGRACTGNITDSFADAGMHYNPNDCPHPMHAGDLPPLFASNGRAQMSFVTDRFRLSEVIGRAVVIHSLPSGNSGEKIACALINEIKTSITFR